jgi:hypothetical protein
MKAANPEHTPAADSRYQAEARRKNTMTFLISNQLLFCSDA